MNLTKILILAFLLYLGFLGILLLPSWAEIGSGRSPECQKVADSSNRTCSR